MRLIVRLIALSTCFALLTGAVPAGAVTSSDARREENKAAEARKKIEQGNVERTRLDRDIKDADMKLNATQEDLTKLEADLAQKRGERDKITAQLNVLRDKLARAQEELDKALKELARLKGILNERAGDVYKHGEVSFLEVLLEARDFSDFVHRAQFLQTIISVDADLVDSIKKTRSKIERTKASIEKDTDVVQKQEDALTVQVEDVAVVTNAVRTKKNELQAQIGSKKTMIVKIQGEQEDWEAEAAEYEKSAARIRSLLTQSPSPTFVSAAPSSSGYAFPTNGSITSGFGQRWGRPHQGIDIGAPMGAAVWASKAGTVKVAGWWGGYGNLVVIDHGGGWSTWYGHNSAVLVSVGQQVTQGQVISKCGSTGHSTGPHVHFEIRYNGTPVNPQNYL